MFSLAHLPPPPHPNQVTACENDGCLRTMNNEAAQNLARQWLGEQNVEICLAPEVARPAHSKHEAKNAFCEHTETPWHRVISVYNEEGVLSALREYFSNIKEKKKTTPFMKFTAKNILSILSVLDKIQEYLPMQLYSHSISNVFESAAADKVNQRQRQRSCHFESSSVVSMDWHPHTCLVAVLSEDDIIRVFGAGRTLSPLLKHRLQKNVCQIAWMPNSASILAIACAGGVLIWTLDPTSVVTRPSGSCLSQLSHPCATPTTSISWHPKGTKLACVGGNGRSIVIWDVGLETSTIVHTSLAGSIQEIIWSPDGSRLLAATSSNVIRVFETREWTYERWILESPLQSAVWSQSGNILLFVTVNEPAIFCLKFIDGEGVGGSQVASQVADLSGITVTTEYGLEVVVGGPAHQISWDKSSERLAIVFRDSEYIALLHTKSSPQLHIAPGGYIRGETGNKAMNTYFQKKVHNGAVLSVVWSHSPIQHIPLRFTSMEANYFDNRMADQSLLNYSLNQTSGINNASRLDYTLDGINGLFSP